MIRQCKSLWTRPNRWRHAGAEELWSLSILRLCKFYGHVTIYTDELGEIFLKALRLPVAGRLQIVRALDDLSREEPKSWALGKLYAYSLQKEPFIHTDGDVVLGRQFPQRIHDAAFCAERLYSNVPGAWFRDCIAPKSWHQQWSDGNGISFNCGLFGGRDTHAIREWAHKALAFARNNAGILARVKDTAGRFRSDLAAIACEEWTIAREIDPLEVSCLSSMDPAGSEMLRRAKAYWHTPGAAKIDPDVRERVRLKLEAECPGQASRCREVAREFARQRPRNSHL